MSIKRILLPINGRDDMAPEADLAFGIARKTQADVEILHHDNVPILMAH